MVKYNLAEFKNWLEEKPERKAGLNWNSSIYLWRTNPNDFNLLIKTARGELNTGIWSGDNLEPFRKVAREFMAETDQKQELAQVKQKLTNFLTARKQTLQQEIQLIREVLND